MIEWERKGYQDLGEFLTGTIIWEMPIALICVGIFTPLYAMVISTLIKRQEKPLHSTATLTIISLSLVATLGYPALQLVVLTLYIKCSLHMGCSAQGPLIFPFQCVMTSMTTLPLIFNDAVIIWRAWSILGKQRWASVISMGLCILSFLVGLVYMATSVVFNWGTWSSNPPPVDFIKLSVLVYPFFGLSLLTNAVATSFIGWTLYKHLQFLRDNKIEKRKLFGAWRILVLLLDSGVIYFILQTAMLGLQFSKISADNYGYSFFAALYQNISYVYPSLTLFIVHEASSIEKFHNSVVALQTSQNYSA